MSEVKDKNYWWEKAKEASAETGWFPTVILAQWQLETGNFASANLLINNNIAGQTWQSYMGDALRGTARPAAEGGYYIKYADPVIGYIDFIARNGRYAAVKLQSTEEGQIRAIAAAGWAVDPYYATKLLNLLSSNRQQGYTLQRANDEEDGDNMPMKLEQWQWDMIYKVLGAAYNADKLQWDYMQKVVDKTLTAAELAFLNCVLDGRVDRNIEV